MFINAVTSIPNVERVRLADVSELTSELFINNVKGTFIYHLGDDNRCKKGCKEKAFYNQRNYAISQNYEFLVLCFL